MKKNIISNSKKIIIFTLLIIGIILISPIINNIVYAGTGKLPAKINDKIFKGEKDDITIELDKSEGFYTQTKGYIENEKYLTKKGYNVEPSIEEGDEFWTAEGSKLQSFDNNYQENNKIPKSENNPFSSTGKLNPFTFVDFYSNIDIYCANEHILLLQGLGEGEIATRLKLPKHSELVARLETFVKSRNRKLSNLSSRSDAPGSYDVMQYLDDYGVRYEEKGPTKQEMKDNFDYVYTGTNPTFPYIWKSKEVAHEFKHMIVEVEGNNQDLGDRGTIENFFEEITSENINKMVLKSLDNAIRAEFGDAYNPDNDYDGDHSSSSIADKENRIRTNNYYEMVSPENKPLSPQAAYALATKPKMTSKDGSVVGDPGDAQEVLWSLEGDQYPDDEGYTGHIFQTDGAKKLKSEAEAFEAYYDSFVKWKANHNNAFENSAKFVETKRDIIFNSKSEKYKEGSWLVGPYKLDYLLSTVKNGNSEKYFAGMTNMKITGEYNDKSKTTIKEILKWSYFVPLQAKGTNLTAEQIAKGEVTSLKYGVPEPNQEFYIEIPFDENLIRIAELTASFRAVDYEASANYYAGIGEYIDFEADIEIEKFEKYSNAYLDVQKPKVKFDITPGDDVGTLTLDFSPYKPSEMHILDGWTREGNTLYKTIKWNEKSSSFTPARGFLYSYDGITAEGTSINGGSKEINFRSFSKPYKDLMYLDKSYQDMFPSESFNVIKYSENNDTYSFMSNINCSSGNYTYYYNQVYSIPKEYTSFRMYFITKGGQTDYIDIPAKEPPLEVTFLQIKNNVFMFSTNIETSMNGGSYSTGHGVHRNVLVAIFRTRGGQTKKITLKDLGKVEKKQNPNFTDKILGLFKNKRNESIPQETKIAEVTNTVEIGKTNKAKIDPDLALKNMPTSAKVNSDISIPTLNEGYRHVLFKTPDVLVVPKAMLSLEKTQPQMKVKGRLKYVDTTAKLIENKKIPDNPDVYKNAPAFVLPIGGKVWEDNPYGDKLSSYNFILNTGNEDKKDRMFEDITVRVNRLIIKNSDQSIVEKQAARVFEKGKYNAPITEKIKTNDKGEWGKYYLRDLGFTRKEIKKGYGSKTHSVKFEVEFEYDGIEYVPVPALASLSYNPDNYNLENAGKAVNDSMAVENTKARDTFNMNMGEINGSSEMDENRKTVGKAIGVEKAPENDYELNYEGKVNDKNRTVSTLKTKRNTRASTLNTGILYPLGDVYEIDMEQAMSNKNATSETNGNFDLVIIMTKEKAEEYKNKEGVTVTDALDNKSVVVFHESNTHMENINLGLFKRRKVDLELESDLMLSIQFINKKALINTFANKYDLKKDENDGYSHLISKYSENYGDLQYQLEIYKADYIYRTAMYKDPDIKEALDTEAKRLAEKNKDQEGRELDVYLQYKQAITNYSQVDSAIVSGLNMYYDETLTPVLEKIEKEIDKEEIEDKNGTGKAAISGSNVVIGTPEYRIVTLDTNIKRNFDDVKAETEYEKIPGLTKSEPFIWTKKETNKGIGMLTTLDDKYGDMDIILPSARRLEVVTNFKVNKGKLFAENGDKVENSIRLGNKHHLTEIAGYATYNKYTGKVTGKVDRDSAPANINLGRLNFTKAGFDGNIKQDFSYLEDDSSVAPMITIKLETEAPREVSGMVWEEKRNNQIARVNMGDGIYNKDEEKPIPNKIVALEERVSIRAVDLSTEYKMEQGFDNKVLKDETNYVDIPYVWENKIEGTGIKISSLRDLIGFQSYMRTGEDGKYKFKNIPAGNFVVQLPYIISGNDITESIGILNKDTIETTKIVDIENRDKSPQVYNGQDFKVSIYDGGNKETLNETWLPSTPKENYSYGRDSEYSRYKLYQNSKNINAKIGGGLEILNIGHDKFDDETRKVIESTANMTAETPVINFGINYYGSVSKENILYNKFADVFALPGITKSNDGKKDVEVPNEAHTYNNVNIALEERPKTKIVLDKQITKLTLKSSEGTKLVDAEYETTYDAENIVIPNEDKNVLKAEKEDKKYDTKRKTQNGYNIGEYILKVKTEIKADSVNGDKVNPLNTIIYATKKPYWEENKSESGIYTNARGWENINIEDPAIRKSNGYIHLNFDKQLLSDMNIEMEYEVRAYNLGEVDRATIQENFKTQSIEDARKDDKVSKYVGTIAGSGEKYSKLNHEIDPDKYGFGRFFGKGYYTGDYTETSKIGDYKLYEETVSKTYVNKVLDYVDNSAVKDDLQTDEGWAQIKNIEELDSLIAVYDDSGNKTYKLETSLISDPDGKSYFKTGGSNIYMNEKMNEGLVPYYEYATAIARGTDKEKISPYQISSKIATKRLSSQQADEDLSFDNIAEIVEYSTDNGRRSTSSTPGNINTRLSETFDAENLEPDTGLAMLVTITPPTGLSKSQKTLRLTLNTMLIIMIGIAGVTVLIKVLMNAIQKNRVLPNEDENNK